MAVPVHFPEPDLIPWQTKTYRIIPDGSLGVITPRSVQVLGLALCWQSPAPMVNALGWAAHNLLVIDGFKSGVSLIKET